MRLSELMHPDVWTLLETPDSWAPPKNDPEIANIVELSSTIMRLSDWPEDADYKEALEKLQAYAKKAAQEHPIQRALWPTLKDEHYKVIFKERKVAYFLGSLGRYHSLEELTMKEKGNIHAIVVSTMGQESDLEDSVWVGPRRETE